MFFLKDFLVKALAWFDLNFTQKNNVQYAMHKATHWILCFNANRTCWRFKGIKTSARIWISGDSSEHLSRFILLSTKESRKQHIKVSDLSREERKRLRGRERVSVCVIATYSNRVVFLFLKWRKVTLVNKRTLMDTLSNALTSWR